MTAEKKSPQINYLTPHIVQVIYEAFYEHFQTIGEPIPSFQEVSIQSAEKISEVSQLKFDGHDLYPTLEEKAAVTMYIINKGHLFPNGNKRLSLALTMSFLYLNGKTLDITNDDATAKALEIANSLPEKYKETQQLLAQWIKENWREIK